MSTKLSIIITAHDEGILAHKMILSIFHALKQVSASYEIVVHIDNGAPETLRYFDRYCSDSRFHILKSHFGDLGKSRNFAVSQSAGEYIIFVDADDLISEHYLSSMLEALESATTPALVHPSYVISYQDTHFQIWQTLSSCSRNRLAFCLFRAINGNLLAPLVVTSFLSTPTSLRRMVTGTKTMLLILK